MITTLLFILSACSTSPATTATPAEVEALKAQVELLEKEVERMERRIMVSGTGSGFGMVTPTDPPAPKADVVATDEAPVEEPTDEAPTDEPAAAPQADEASD